MARRPEYLPFLRALAANAASIAPEPDDASTVAELDKAAKTAAAEEGELGRTLVCYKETQSVDKLDPEPGAWTGTFRDSAWGTFWWARRT